MAELSCWRGGAIFEMEILLRIVDKNPLEPSQSQAGDVIAIRPDGWNWSFEERNNDFWRIIQAPILQTLADALLSEPATLQDAINKGNRFRNWKINFALLPNASLFIGPRTQEIIVLKRNNIIAAATQKL